MAPHQAWSGWTRTVSALTPAELVEGARKIAAYSKELNEDIQAKTAALKAGTLSEAEDP